MTRAVPYAENPWSEMSNAPTPRHVCGDGQSRQTESKQTAIERYRLFDITERAGTPVIGTSHTAFVDVDQRTRHDVDWQIRLHRQAWQYDSRRHLVAAAKSRRV